MAVEKFQGRARHLLEIQENHGSAYAVLVSLHEVPIISEI
jgi:hypothetical protein